MAVTVQALYDVVTKMEVSLVSGAGGLSNYVNWTHTVENQRIVNFLIGGEIVFTTGMRLDETFSLMDLVRSIYEKNASGLIINTGPYIQTIPDDVIAFSNKHNFPVFKAPWHVHMAEINRNLCFSIMHQEKAELENQVTFQNAMLCPNPENEFVRLLERKGFAPEWRYQVVVVESEDVRQLYQALGREIDAALKRCVTFLYDEKLYFITYCRGDRRSEEGLAHIFELAKAISPWVRISGGPWVLLNKLNRSYSISLKMALLYPNECQLITYRMMGPYRVILNVDEIDVLEAYVRDIIGALLEHDALSKNGDLVKVLKSYLNSNGSVLKTSKELYVHRNTINYKLKKIEELIGRNLSDINTRTELVLALLSYDVVLQHKKL